MFFFFLSFSLLGFFFWFLVFNCRVTRVARGVFFGLGWVGVGVHYTTWGKFCPRLDYTGTCYLLFIDEMEGEDGRVWAGGRRQDAFC